MTFSTRKLAGRDIPAIGLGCMSLSQAYHPIPPENDGVKVLNRALDLGCLHLDSARLYGWGHNEELISRVMKTRREDAFLVSKCGIELGEGKRWVDCSPENIRRNVEISLQKFGVEHIDLYYLHRRDFKIPIEESVGELARLKSEGKIGAIGLSEMSAETVRKGHAEHPVDALQNEYSLWSRNPELGTLEACKELGIAFVAFSPVARGALAAAVENRSDLVEKDLRYGHPRFNEENWPKNKTVINQFNSLAAEAGVTPAQLSLYWVLAQGDHVHAIPGTGNISHLEENWATLDLVIDKDILDRADKLINQSTIAGHRYPEGMRKTIDTEDYPLSADA